MKIAPRLLLGTLATAAALGGSALSAHADVAGGSGSGSAGTAGSAGSDDGASLDMNSMLCPVASSGVIGKVLDGLNPESLAGACGGASHPNTSAKS